MTRLPTWAAYRAICDTPAVWSRWMLLCTAELLDAFAEQALAASLRDACDRAPLPKPLGHRGPPATDMFRIALAPSARDRIVAILGQAVAAGWQVSGPSDIVAAWAPTHDRQGRHLGGFVAAWLEYAQSGRSDAAAGTASGEAAGAPADERSGEPAGEPTGMP